MPIPGPKKAIRLAAKSLKDGIQSAKKIGTLSDLASFAEGADSLLALKDKAFADIVLESIGASIPLPTQSQVKIFYQDLEGKKRNELPSNPLAYTDPQDWNEAEYIQYQTDYRKYQASQKLKNIKRKSGESLAKAKRRVKKEVDGERKRLDTLIKLFTDFNSELNENLKDDITDDQKAKGIQTFPQLFQVILKQTAKTFFTSLSTTYKEAGLETIEARKNELLEKYGINDLNELPDPNLIKQTFCPTEPTLDRLILQRNNMVDYLNNQQERINNLKKPIELSGETVDFLQKTSTTIALTTFITNQAAKIIPLIPGVIVSLINDLNTIRETILFKNDGTARIPPIKSAISNVNIPLNQLSKLITKIVFALGDLDDLIALCRPNAELNSLSPEVLATVAIQLASDTLTSDENLYKGFRLEIETRPYTDTVNQNRAVGKNQSGIILINTDWSFASDPNVLIRELQFKIDTENLVSY